MSFVEKILINIRYSNVFKATSVFHANKHSEAMKRENENLIVHQTKNQFLLFYSMPTFF